jgi:hypothetical protein
MMGDEWPRPGMCVFHFIFFPAFHSVGSPVSGEMPWPLDPRHCDQFAPPFESLVLACEVGITSEHIKVVTTVTSIKASGFFISTLKTFICALLYYCCA